VIAFNGLVLSSVLDQFSAKSGHVLRNKQCFSQTNCTFDDTFNRQIAVKNIKIESRNNFLSYKIVVQHVLSYDIQVLSFPIIEFRVRNKSNIPRIETIIDVTLNSSLFTFNIDITIRRCDLFDSPFLLLFTHLMPNIVPMGDAQCQAIKDHTTLIIDANILSNQEK
jgi:hypothetical protein